MEQDLPSRQIGLYIHIPWCLTRCGYCNFFSKEYNKKDFRNYLDFLLKEKEKHLLAGIPPLVSVYFGGGTPSLLSPQEINRILDGIPLAENAEITLETNPLQITPTFCEGLALSPVNRISLGIQSMDDEELGYLGRRHHARDIAPKINLLNRAGFRNISGDFIYGLPGSNYKQVKEKLLRMLELPLEHLSCYLLELYPNTPLGKDAALLPGEDESARQYHSIRELCASKGFAQYEISNFALPGFESRHNLLYWEGNEYLAFGASAAGFYKGKRYAHPASLSDYFAAIERSDLFFSEDPAQDNEADYIMLRLRLAKGMDLSEYSRRFGKNFLLHKEKEILKLQRLGFIETNDNCIRLSPKAYFISNAVILELL